MNEFEGRGAIITGAASGIGAATARRFAASGARVAVVDRDADAAHAVAASIDGAIALQCDVRDSERVEAVVAATLAAFGDASLVVNNAGIGDLRPMHTVDDKLWHRLLDVNLTGTFAMMRAVVPHMLAAGRGAIVNNASLSGMAPTRNEAAYSAAKAGVIALTKSGALEYGPTIRVNCVAPGFIETPLTVAFQQMPETFEPIRDQIPLHRMGAADEVAEVIAFLCSDRASYVTGQTCGRWWSRPPPSWYRRSSRRALRKVRVKLTGATSSDSDETGMRMPLEATTGFSLYSPLQQLRS